MENEFIYSDDRQEKIDQAMGILENLHADSSFVLVQLKLNDEGGAFEGNAIVSMHNEEHADDTMIEALGGVALELRKESFMRMVSKSGLSAAEFVGKMVAEFDKVDEEVDDECEESE